MSALKTRRADDCPIPVSITTPEEKKPATSPDEVQRFLKQARFSTTLHELGGLVIRANTREQLLESIAEAKHGAKRQGMYVTRDVTKITKKERLGSPKLNFEASRQRAVERVGKRTGAKSETPKTQCEIGTQFGQWETISLPFFDKPYLVHEKRSAMVRVRCKCGAEESRAISSLKQSRTKECKECSDERRRERHRKGVAS